MIIDGYSLIKSLGRGEFGEVFLAQKNETGQLFAIKKVSKKKVEVPSIKKYFLNEVTILKELQHKNIIKLETIRQTIHNYYIITEYYNGGGLTECLRKHKMIKGRPFSEEVVQHLMRQIIDALIYLHSKRIVHRDLKLDNLLVNFESEEDKKNLNMLKAEVKIIDFGFATYLDNTGLRYSILGSPINMDPVLLTKLINQNVSNLIGYSEQADIWSLGTVCYELITGRVIFHAQNVIDLVRLVEEGIYHIPTELSQEIVSFLTSMLQYSSKNRLSAVELSNHPFLTKNVNEFTRLDLTQLPYRIDQNGIILNIKKDATDRPIFDVQARLNYYQQQQYYKNIRSNTNMQYPTGYNYFANTGPKYYMANPNPYRQMTNNPQSKPVQGIISNPLINQYNYNNNLKQAYTYQEQNNNQKYNLNYPNNLNYNNYTIYKNQKQKDSDLSKDLNEIYPKNLRTHGQDKGKDYLQYKNGLNQQISQNNNNYYNNYNVYSNNPISNKIPYQYSQNSTGVLPISNTVNPMPIPFSGPIPVNNRMAKSPIQFSGMDDDIHSTPNPFYENHHHIKNKLNNRSIQENRKNIYTDTNKEITSEALDGLFDFNIGKELEPEPEFTIEKKNNKKHKNK